jgi:hypothetical protein
LSLSCPPYDPICPSPIDANEEVLLIILWIPMLASGVFISSSVINEGIPFKLDAIALSKILSSLGNKASELFVYYVDSI